MKILLLFASYLVLIARMDFVYRMHFATANCERENIHAYQESAQGSCENFSRERNTSPFSQRYYFDDTNLYVLWYDTIDCDESSFSRLETIPFGCAEGHDGHSVLTTRGINRNDVGLPKTALSAEFYTCDHTIGSESCLGKYKQHDLDIEGFHKAYWYYHAKHVGEQCLPNYSKGSDGTIKKWWNIFRCDTKNNMFKFVVYSDEDPNHSCTNEKYKLKEVVMESEVFVPHPNSGDEESPDTYVISVCENAIDRDFSRIAKKFHSRENRGDNWVLMDVMSDPQNPFYDEMYEPDPTVEDEL